jgi:hypothetical protein
VFTLEGGYTPEAVDGLVPAVATLLAAYQFQYKFFLTYLEEVNAPAGANLGSYILPRRCMPTPEFADALVEEVELLIREGKTFSSHFPALLAELKGVAKFAPLAEGRRARLMSTVQSLISEVIANRPPGARAHKLSDVKFQYLVGGAGSMHAAYLHHSSIDRVMQPAHLDASTVLTMFMLPLCTSRLVELRGHAA